MQKDTESPYKYKEWINKALLEVIKKTIHTVEKYGLYKDIHFFVTFNTQHSLVKLSPFLKEKYSKTMTIVLQNQFQDLKTEENGFHVTLFFAANPTKLFIPWQSIIQVLDPTSSISLTVSQEDNIKEENTEKVNTQIIKFPNNKDK